MRFLFIFFLLTYSLLFANISTPYSLKNNTKIEVVNNISFVDDITINNREFDSLEQEEIEFYAEDLIDGKVIIEGLLESEDKNTSVNSLFVEITTDGGKTWSRAKGHKIWEWSFKPKFNKVYKFSLRVVKDIIKFHDIEFEQLPKIAIKSIYPSTIPRGVIKTLQIRGEKFTPKLIFDFSSKDIIVLSSKFINKNNIELKIKSSKNSKVEVATLRYKKDKTKPFQVANVALWVVDKIRMTIPKLQCNKEPKTDAKIADINIEPKSIYEITPVIVDGATSQSAHAKVLEGYIPFLDDQTVLKWDIAGNTKPAQFVVNFYTPDKVKVKSFTITKNAHHGIGQLKLTPNQLYELYKKIPAKITHDSKNNAQKEKLLYYVDNFPGSRFLFWEVIAQSKIRSCKDYKLTKLAQSKFGALRMGAAPTGTSCDSRNQLLTATKKGGKKGEAFYPGDTLELYGEFSLENSPWRPTHLVIDWGNGEYDNLEIKDYDRNAALQCANVANGSFDCKLETTGQNQMIPFSIEHTYNQAGRFKVRVYVLPQEDISKIDSIAQKNKKQDAKELAQNNSEKPTYYATTNLIKNDGYKNIKFSSASSLNNMSKIVSSSDRIFEVYCNPLDIYIVKDPAATGPLSLELIKIYDFSTNNNITTFGNNTNLLTNTTNISYDKKVSYSKTIKNPFPSNKNHDKKAHTEVSSCDGVLLSRAKLSFHGQGYVKIIWKVDGVVVSESNMNIGPSTKRENLNYKDKSSWQKPINDELIINSVELPIQDIAKHTLSVSAQVIPDPTGSNIDISALDSILNKSKQNINYHHQSLPIIPKESIHFYPIFSSTKSSNTFLNKIKTSIGSVKNIKPYFVSDDGYYTVTKHSSSTPCTFKYPVEDGKFLKIFNIKNLKKTSNGYSGDANVLFYLNNTKLSAGVYFMPIHFKNWVVNEQNIVTKGKLITSQSRKIDNIEGMNITIKSLYTSPYKKLTAILDVQINSSSLFTASSGNKAKAHKWVDLKALLSYKGDWYISNQKLPITRIGWSLFNISSSSVAIDLSKENKKSLCGSKEFIGIDLGSKAKLYPYTFNLANDIKIDVKDWAITSNGLCGSIFNNKGFSHVFGDGKIGWKGLSVIANNHNLRANYKGFYVDMAWPKLHLNGGDVELNYKSNQDNESKVSINFDLSKTLNESYGATKLKIKKIKSFEKRKFDWGIATQSQLNYVDRDGKNKIVVDIDDIFFSIFSTVGFGKDNKEQTQIKLDKQTINLGGAVVDVNSVTLKANQAHGKSKKLDTKFIATLTLDKWSQTQANLTYELEKKSKNIVAYGPDISKFKPISRKYPEVNSMNNSTLKNLKYIPKASSAYYNLPNKTYYVSNLFDSLINHKNYIDIGVYPQIAGLNVNASNDDCSAMANDTFSAHVDTQYFGEGPSIAATFRYGTLNNKSYWLIFSQGTFMPGIPIFPAVSMYKLKGGAVWRFNPEDLAYGSGCNSTPNLNYGLGLAFGVGLEILSSDIAKIESTMVINPTEKKIGFYNISGQILKQIDIDEGKIEYVYGSHFQTILGAKVGLPKGEEYLSLDATNGKFGKIDLRLGGEYYLHIGTQEASNRIKGKLLIFDGDMYIMAGTDIKGVKAGLSTYFGFSTEGDSPCTKSRADCASIGVSTDTDFALSYSPFGFDLHKSQDFSVSACIDVGKTICINPSLSGYFDMSCCSSVKIAAGMELDLPYPAPDVGLYIGIVPVDFDVDIHW